MSHDSAGNNWVVCTLLWVPARATPRTGHRASRRESPPGGALRWETGPVSSAPPQDPTPAPLPRRRTAELRRLPARTVYRALLLVALIAAGCTVALVTDLPDVVTLRGWLADVGPPGWALLVVGLALATLAPVLRTALPLLAGVLGGLSGMSWRDYLAGSALGIGPGTVLHVTIGATVGAAGRDGGISLLLSLAPLTRTLVVLGVVARRRRASNICAKRVVASSLSTTEPSSRV